MYRNKAKKLEGKVLETDDLESIKEAYAELQREKEEREEAEAAEIERKEAETFRDKVIAEYPEAVQAAAKKLITKNKDNLSWANAKSWDDARSQLASQLDALKEVLVPNDTAEEDEPTVHPNNPAKGKPAKKFEDMTLAEMEKELGFASPR